MQPRIGIGYLDFETLTCPVDVDDGFPVDTTHVPVQYPTFVSSEKPDAVLLVGPQACVLGGDGVGDGHGESVAWAGAGFKQAIADKVIYVDTPAAVV